MCVCECVAVYNLEEAAHHVLLNDANYDDTISQDNEEIKRRRSKDQQFHEIYMNETRQAM